MLVASRKTHNTRKSFEDAEEKNIILLNGPAKDNRFSL